MGRRRIAAAIVLAVMQVAVIVSLALAGPDDSTHRAPIRIVAPPVVATSLVEAANGVAGRPFEARALATAEEARESVRAGRSVAAVVVDLAQERDVLYVASANGAALNRVIEREVDVFEGAFGRTAVVHDLVPAKNGDPGHRLVYVLAGVSVLMGLLVAIVATWRHGPRAETLLDGTRRFFATSVAAVVLGGLIGAFCAAYYDTGLGIWWLVTSLTILAATSTTLALQSVFGVFGIGVATTLIVLSAAPLVRLVHPLMLPQPWAAVTPWLPHGAALDAGASHAYFGGDQVLRPVLILTAWIALSLLTTVVARRERQRELTGDGAPGGRPSTA
ncbi:hypothetical protein [Aeromicrobium sp. UC242_57]|uniref:hypothetical protein n=1 Tax=Aeromicrobium sp. UC242_57 TaxID=3374624 RepID=UPI0037ACB281